MNSLSKVFTFHDSRFTFHGFKEQRGSATILALLISGVIITVGIGFNWIVREHLRAAEGLKNKAEAMVRARSIYDTLIYSMLSGKTMPRDMIFTAGGDILGINSIPLNNTATAVKPDVDVRIQDGGGLISLTNADIGVLGRLIRNALPGENRAAVVADSYLDWTERGQLVRLNGAGEMYYHAEGKPYGPRHYPLQYKEEFSFIRGMDNDLYNKVSPSITLLPNLGFNPNTAGDDVLMAYLDINKDTLETLKAYMTKRPITSNGDLFTVAGRTVHEGFGSNNFYPSHVYEITISVGRPSPVYTIRAGVEMRPSLKQPYSVLYWEQG